MKKILLTGSQGYIGTIMAHKLLAIGYDVIGIDTGFYADENLNQSNIKDYHLIKKDIRYLSAQDLDLGVDACIHLAALSNDPLGNLNKQITYDINHLASVNLAKKLKSLGCKRFIFASSCSLYGQGEGNQLTEESPANPQTAYGEAKILAENDIKLLADDSFSPIFMRNATAFGFSPRMRFDIVVNNLVGYAETENEIKILGDGTPYRPLVHIQDICDAMIAVLDAPQSIIHNQAFNVGDNSENYQVKDIANKVKEFYPNCSISIKQKQANDTRDYHVSFDKLNKQLNYKCNWTLADGIEELRAIYQSTELSTEKFCGNSFNRISKIKALIEARTIDTALNFQS
ncbi:MAG: SDR family oxidoreductase [bacterium]